MSLTQPAPAERFAAIVRCLTHAVITRAAFGLPQSLITLIIDRLRWINQRVARIARKVRQGRYVRPRRTASPLRRTGPRRPNPLPQGLGWLQSLVPEAPQFRAQLEHLLRDPEMVALLAAAPGLHRPVRSLCRMLRVEPPPVLALPKPARAAPPQRPPPAPPACHPEPAQTPICGPPPLPA